MAAHAIGRVVIVELADADGKAIWFVLRQMHGTIRGPWLVRYVQNARRIPAHLLGFLRHGIADGELMIYANQTWLIVWAVTLSLAVGQEFRLTEKLKAAVIAVIVDALAVKQLMAIQEMLELELLVALVANVDAAVLLMQMIVQEDSAKGTTTSQYIS